MFLYTATNILGFPNKYNNNSMRNAAAAGGREREGEKLVIISRTNSLLCAVAKGGSGKVFFVSASSSYFLFKVGGGLPPPLTMWEMWFWVGVGKRDRETKVSGFIMWQTFFRRGGTLELSRNSPPSPRLSPLLFSFALLCNVHHRRHIVVASKSVLFPRLGSRCVRLLATLFAGGRHFGALAAFPAKNAPLHPQFVFRGGGEECRIFAPRERPNFAKQTAAPSPRWMQPSDAFCPHPEPPHTGPTLRKIMKKGAKT